MCLTVFSLVGIKAFKKVKSSIYIPFRYLKQHGNSFSIENIEM